MGGESSHEARRCVKPHTEDRACYGSARMPVVRPALVVLPALAVLAAAGGAQALAPASAGAFRSAEVVPTAGGEGTITKIGPHDRVPLEGPRVDAKPGDWLMENAGSVAVVSADGRLVDFGARGGRDEITG